MPISDADFEAALEALTSDPERFRQAEERLSSVVPQLHRMLIGVLHESGYFDEGHESQVLKAATTPDADDRITAVRTLLMEEARVGMLVGVAVGWELARELESKGD